MLKAGNKHKVELGVWFMECNRFLLARKVKPGLDLTARPGFVRASYFFFNKPEAMYVA
jgi:hypothetical protein